MGNEALKCDVYSHRPQKMMGTAAQVSQCMAYEGSKGDSYSMSNNSRGSFMVGKVEWLVEEGRTRAKERARAGAYSSAITRHTKSVRTG